MGIINLMNFIKKKDLSIFKYKKMIQYQNKTLAIDSHTLIYKFLIKTISHIQGKVNKLTDSKGNSTGHLIGVLYKALLCIENGVKPIWVFDGVPPVEKLSELKRRKNLRQKAEQKSQQAFELGDIIEAARQTQRKTIISKTQLEEVKKIIELMGMPIITSYSEAEAQCAWLTKNNLADGVISQDLDNLVFGTTNLVRNFSRDKFAEEISRQELLKALNLTQDQFIDFCILCGCDYTSKIKQIGPSNAYKLIQQHKNIENVIKIIVNDEKMKKRFQIPDEFNYLRARTLFKNPLINQSIKQSDVKQKQVNYEGLKEFLISKDFSENRINNWINVAQISKKNFQLIN